jgi:hypothetical protein
MFGNRKQNYRRRDAGDWGGNPKCNADLWRCVDPQKNKEPRGGDQNRHYNASARAHHWLVPIDLLIHRIALLLIVRKTDLRA